MKSMMEHGLCIVSVTVAMLFTV